MERLAPFVGEWSLPRGGRTVFEWLPGRRFLVQRWEVPDPGVPDGIAIIGFDRGRGSYLQHRFDSRGVVQVYEMGFDDRGWTLRRESADFSPLEFVQRFTAGSARTAGPSPAAGNAAMMGRTGSTTSTSRTRGSRDLARGQAASARPDQWSNRSPCEPP